MSEEYGLQRASAPLPAPPPPPPAPRHIEAAYMLTKWFTTLNDRWYRDWRQAPNDLKRPRPDKGHLTKNPDGSTSLVVTDGLRATSQRIPKNSDTLFAAALSLPYHQLLYAERDSLTVERLAKLLENSNG